ncbi:hypothetical protein MMC27_000169 [Xylographa pallens]|nr:hypothetical protein [Xylographa pallens]
MVVKEYGAGADEMLVVVTVEGSSVQVSVEAVAEEELGRVYVYKGYEGIPGADVANVGPRVLVLKTGNVKDDNGGDVTDRPPSFELTDGMLKVYEIEEFAELGAKPLLAVPRLLYDGGVGMTVSVILL